MRERKKTLSPEAAEVLRRIPDDLRRKFLKSYKYKAGRDNAIAELRKSGVKVRVIAEITGLHKSSVDRILAKKDDVHKVDFDSLLDQLMGLNSIMEANYRALRGAMKQAINTVSVARQHQAERR